GLVHGTGDQLRGERYVREDVAQRARRLGVLPFLVDDVPVNGDDRGHGGLPNNVNGPGLDLPPGVSSSFVFCSPCFDFVRVVPVTVPEVVPRVEEREQEWVFTPLAHVRELVA